MGKAPKALHDVPVIARVAQVALQRFLQGERAVLDQRLEAPHAFVLQAEVFGVHQWHVEKHAAYAGQDLIVVQRQGSLDRVSVEVEALVEVSSVSYPGVAIDVAHYIKSMIGISTTITVQPAGTIPRSQGKAVRVRDLRPKG